ncbi:MAG: Choline kinase [Hydrocarboniphaga sp.]|uniref:phosphocholine cytidylyltransferase family protein n=1 Tax=Hydrocarboniphaga sp. TaxID=2033016 RepID=UPI002616DC0F|nr:phosphocholine cytidylyltransferase family protein [Hydrocarboniphaga sp.]MDB5968135.1 Choline kinase [Hydrocarboniphaga sp.]
MKAIVLSAGQGSRLLPLTISKPKCLVEFSGRSLLEWQLEALHCAGVTEAVVVTGFGADQVEAVLAERAPLGLKVRTIYNPFYKLADNLATCWLVRDEMQGAFLILNGDTLIEPAIVRRLLKAPPAPITVSIDRKPQYDADDMKVRTAGTQLTAIGKTLSEDIDGESIGFLRFSREGAARFVEQIDRVMHTPEGVKLWYLSAINGLAQAGCAIEVASIEGLQWGEVDFHPDVARARAMTASWSARWLPQAPVRPAAGG